MEGSNSQWQGQLWSNEARLLLKIAVKLGICVHVYQLADMKDARVRFVWRLVPRFQKAKTRKRLVGWDSLQGGHVRTLHKTGTVRPKEPWRETPEYWRARTLGLSAEESYTLGAESTQRKAVCVADSRAREMGLLKPLEHKQSRHQLQMPNLEPQNLVFDLLCLGFPFLLSNLSLLWSPLFFFEWECLLGAIVWWKYKRFLLLCFALFCFWLYISPQLEFAWF